MKKIIFVILCLLFIVSTGHAADVTLAWDANTDPRVDGYKLYYGTTAGVYGAGIDVGKVTQFTLTGVAEGVNIFFAVTAYDTTDKLESAFSTELPCWTIVPSIVGSGTITPSVAKVVSAINSQTFTITPNTGNRTKDVAVDGVSIGVVATYTFQTGMKTSHTIKATFEPIPAAVPKTTGLKIIG